MDFITLRQRLEKLGFFTLSYSNEYQLFSLDLSVRSSLIIEGNLYKRSNKFSYDFYKISYNKKKNETYHTVIYERNTTVTRMYTRVQEYLTYIKVI